MAKDPAFLFYPGDWLTETHWMTFEQKGAYLELLVLQWGTGGFTIEQARQVLGTPFPELWEALKSKFTETQNIFSSERLREEIEKRRKFSESRRTNRLGTKTSETEGETEKKSEEKTEKKSKEHKFIPPTVEEVKEYFKENGYSEESAIKAYNFYKVGGWKDSRGNQVKNWKQKMLSVWFKEENKKNTGLPAGHSIINGRLHINMPTSKPL